MKRTGLISFAIVVLAASIFLIAQFTNRASCFRSGAVPDSIAQASEKIGKLLYQTGKTAWSDMGVSEKDLINAMDEVEVTGPAMTFEHHSARYVKFRLSICAPITKPITVGFHCGETPNLGWVAKSCRSTDD